MLNLSVLTPIDYLIIGHITHDILPGGLSLGGTATYSALTASALGLRVGILTAIDQNTTLSELNHIPVCGITSDYTTTFENINSPEGRIQYIYHRADNLSIAHVPDIWRKTPIVHLAPVAQEIEPSLANAFPNAFIGLTPQGWLRKWDENGKISISEWPESAFVLEKASASIISIEDIDHDEDRIQEMNASCRIFVVTEGAKGSRLYWNGDLRYFPPPEVVELDSTGAGDIFAACFFCRLFQTQDPWEAARFATQLAAQSVTRAGLNSIPTPQEIQNSTIQVLN